MFALGFDGSAEFSVGDTKLVTKDQDLKILLMVRIATNADEFQITRQRYVRRQTKSCSFALRLGLRRDSIRCCEMIRIGEVTLGAWGDVSLLQDTGAEWTNRNQESDIR
jgi:hypothetical protein